jgi:hypothetical protein
MTNNLKELDKAFEPFYCSSMDCNMGHLMMEDENGDAQEYGQCKCSYAIEEAKRVALTLINQKEKELLEKFEEIVGKDEPGKSEFDLGSEFSTPRDIRRNASNYLKAEIRYGIKQLKEELKEGE